MMRLLPVCALLAAALLAVPVTGATDPAAPAAAAPAAVPGDIPPGAAALNIPGETIATLDGEFVSLAAGPEGLFLLSADNRVVRVLGNETTALALPALAPSAPPGRFSDLAVLGGTFYLCRAQETRVYVFDPAKPQAWSYLMPQGLPAGQAGFTRIAAAGTFLGVGDADGSVFLLEPDGRATRRPAGELLFPSRDGPGLRIDREGTADGLLSWQVRDAAGHVRWSRQGQDPATNVVGMTVLGFDPAGRLVVAEAAGNRDGGQTWQVLAIAEGKAAAARPLAGPGALLAVRTAALLDDGSVAGLTGDPVSKKTILYKVTF
ncbi:MAG: hypothetical protein GX442_05160 [Candidatus Riflebacteria bacterium]|nr:hypothetical protein [Candidatus Riflebacteria bacterium]